MTPVVKGWVIGLGIADVVLFLALLAVVIVGATATPDRDPTPGETATTQQETDDGGAAAPQTTSPAEGAPATPTSTASPSPTDPATPVLAAAPAGALELASFALPSRNITCSMSEATVTCEIADASFSPPAGPECEWRGQVVLMDSAGVQLPCPQTAPGAASADVPVLDYGQTSAVGPFWCGSSEQGVQCESRLDGTGFSLARAELASYGPGAL